MSACVSTKDSTTRQPRKCAAKSSLVSAAPPSAVGTLARKALKGGLSGIGTPVWETVAEAGDDEGGLGEVDGGAPCGGLAAAAAAGVATAVGAGTSTEPRVDGEVFLRGRNRTDSG